MTTFVHIGIGKTGTTSIQSFLSQSREPLLRLGFLYPQSGLIGNAHYGLFNLRTSEVTEESFANLAEEVSVSGVRNVILSSENLTYAPMPVIEYMRDALGDDVRVVFYVREQVGLIQSTFLQWVKDGWDYLGSIERFLDAHYESFDYIRLIGRWATHFDGRIAAHVYHPAVTGPSTAEHFLRVVGVPDLTPPYERHNPSLLPDFFELIRRIDAAGIAREPRQDIIAALLDMSVEFSHSSRSLLSPELINRIHSLYKASNEEFAQRYLPDAERSYLTAMRQR